jgi:hypothetical protein
MDFVAAPPVRVLLSLFRRMESVALGYDAAQRIGNWFCGVNTLGNALGVLANSALLVVRKLGTGFIVACFVALGLGYAVCLAVGTVYMRIGLASPAPLKQQ